MFIWQLIVKGGYVMWPIIACSFISFAIFFERWQYYTKMGKEIEDRVIEPCKGDFSLVARKEILQSSVNLFINRLNDYINYLEVIVTISPLLGLLGTVTGMISSFNVLSVSSGQPFAITGGVSEALIATATGLCVAILALCLYTVLMQRQNRIINRLEEVCDAYIKESARGNHGI